MRQRLFIRVLVVSLAVVVFTGETVYYVAELTGGILLQRSRGEFLKSELVDSLSSAEAAARWLGESPDVDARIVEVLLFGMDLADAGIEIELPLSIADSIDRAHYLVSRMIKGQPYKAYYWSLASDVYFHEGLAERRASVIDLAEISEDPLDNLNWMEWKALGSLTIAANLEHSNYIYRDLLVETYLEMGVDERSAVHTRMAVAALPDLDEHRYLSRNDAPLDMIQAGMDGFEDALAGKSLVPWARIALDAGRLLMRHQMEAGAIEFLEQAKEEVPNDFLPYYLLGQAYQRVGRVEDAIEQFSEAAARKEGDPWPMYRLGLAHQAYGNYDEAIASLTEARTLSRGEIKIFHALGRVFEEAGRFEEAERQFVAAANTHRENPAGWFDLISFYMRMGRRTDALKACDKLLILDVDVPEYVERCQSIKSEPR